MLAGPGHFYAVAVVVALRALAPSELLRLVHGATVQDVWSLWLKFSNKSCVICPPRYGGVPEVV